VVATTENYGSLSPSKPSPKFFLEIFPEGPVPAQKGLLFMITDTEAAALEHLRGVETIAAAEL
jgi:hypothetical protein